MDSAEEACDYDAMDHSAVNKLFVSDFLCHLGHCKSLSAVLDVGAGTAQIPIELCRSEPLAQIVAIDLAEHMLRIAADNVRRAGLEDRIRLERVDAKRMPYADGSFVAVISNSIIHHIPEPAAVFAEIRRVAAPGAPIFVRDLLRPTDDAAVAHLVNLYAVGANHHQRQMFGDSLRAALTLEEVRAHVSAIGFAADSIQQTSDRHWTWAPFKAGDTMKLA